MNILKKLKIKKKKSLHEFEGDHIINANSKFNTLESYKVARTNIMFSLPKSEEAKIILVSSSEPGEGKTTSSINLAYTFAQTGAKVLLIDCDMRKPRVHRYIKISKDIGLSNILCGFTTVEKAIQKKAFGDIDCIPVGEIPLNSAELLMSDAMKTLLADLSKQYDYIFIDTPPIMTVTDAMIIAPMASGVVLVVRENQSTFEMVDKTVDLLRRADIKILGFLMTYSQNSAKSRSYGRKYYSRGYYRYGYKYEYKEDSNTGETNK